MADFFKTIDEKFILKFVNKKEFKMFIDFAPSYFEYMKKVVFDKFPSCLAKIMGAYSIKMSSLSGVRKVYVLILENINLGLDPA